jgi:hypothetical protein
VRGAPTDVRSPSPELAPASARGARGGLFVERPAVLFAGDRALPELGALTHPDLAPAFDFGWSFPVAVAFDAHVGAEVRAWV